MGKVTFRGWIPDDDPPYREPYRIQIGGFSKGRSKALSDKSMSQDEIQPNERAADRNKPRR
jgi:hypothetical protein